MKVEEKQLEQLNEFGKRFMELKAYLLNLKLESQDNVRLAIERLDDGFLRGREAIFAMPMVTTELADDHASNDAVSAPEVTEDPLVAVH